MAEALAASTVKVAARDVLATWKVLVSLAATVRPPPPGLPSCRAANFPSRFSSQPVLYLFYAILATYLSYRWNAPAAVSHWMPVYVFAGLPFGAMSALKFGEAAMDVLKSVPALSLPSLF